MEDKVRIFITQTFCVPKAHGISSFQESYSVAMLSCLCTSNPTHQIEYVKYAQVFVHQFHINKDAQRKGLLAVLILENLEAIELDKIFFLPVFISSFTIIFSLPFVARSKKSQEVRGKKDVPFKVNKIYSIITLIPMQPYTFSNFFRSNNMGNEMVKSKHTLR